MHKLQLTLACGRYDRTQPLIDGRVQPEGVELTFLPLRPGETFWRMLNHGEFDVSQMKACSFLQGVKHLDPTIMPAERCLEMATINAANALGPESEIGSIEPGKLADIAIFDLNTRTRPPRPIRSQVSSFRPGGPMHILCSSTVAKSLETASS